MRLKHLLKAATTTLVVLAPTGQAFAQGNLSVDDAPDRSGPIVVTGSRIRRPNDDSSVPVTSIDQEQLLSTASLSVGDVLSELPSLRSTFTSANSTRGIGTTGLNILDLRGLGTQRTLVLVNGRRHVPAREGTGDVDVSTIPGSLIERVDIVTGGNSSIYGSDAMAGVVNFILRTDFEGIEARARYGISSRGDGPSYLASLTAGTNFADGRGNVAINAEYSRNHDFLVVDRPGARDGEGFLPVDFDEEDDPNGSDGNPDNVFSSGLFFANFSDGGTFVPRCPTPGNPAANPMMCLPNGQTRLFRFQPDGSLVESNYGTFDARALENILVNGDGSRAIYGQLQPDVERFNVNLLFHYEVSPAFVPYVEAKFIRINAFQLDSPSFDVPGFVSYENPFLSQAVIDFIQARQTPAQIASGGFRFNRENVDLGIRSENNRRDTWRAVIGARGTFNDDWSYDVSLNYGAFKRRLEQLNDRFEQRYIFATDVVRNPANGQPACRVTVDPSARVPIEFGIPSADAEFARRLAQDVAECMPLNIIGEGRASQEAINYAFGTTTGRGRQTQFAVGGNVAGDLSQWFELPGGPVGFALGFEYRRETTSRVFDEAVTAGILFSNRILPFRPPAFEVSEAFGEVRIPILADVPFAREFTIEAAGRIADYRGATGTVFAYNVGGIYEPLAGLRLRANYSKAVRAPNLFESYRPEEQTFAFVDDPCDEINVGAGSDTRAANCAADGIPTDFANEPIRDGSDLSILVSGNQNLREETSRSLTLGAVIQPRVLPGFTLSADYYDIRIENVIAQVSAQQVLNGCYDAPSLDNVFCDLFARDPVTKFFSPGTLRVTNVNFAARTARGVDLDASYRTRIADHGNLNLRLILTHVLERNNYPLVDNPTFPDRILGELGDPAWVYTFQAGYEFGRFSVNYELRYIGPQYVASAESFESVGGRPPQDADFVEDPFFPDIYYHDVRVGFDINNDIELSVGVENIFDRLPPLGGTGRGEGGGIFDNRGRFFHGSVTARF